MKKIDDFKFKVIDDRSVIYTPPFVNIHTHISHRKRFDENLSYEVLEGKPNSNNNFYTNLRSSLIECEHFGTQAVLTSLRPENVDDFISVVGSYSTIVIPFLSVKNYHDFDYVILQLQKLREAYIVMNLPIRPGILIHSLYNISLKKFCLYYDYCKLKNISMMLHFFEFLSELEFYNNENPKKQSDPILEKLKYNWRRSDFVDLVDKLLFTKLDLHMMFVHCCYLPLKKRQLHPCFNAIICPSSNIRLSNEIPSYEHFSNFCIATDGYFTNYGYNLINEIKVYHANNRNCGSIRERSVRLFDSITSTPLQMIFHNSICANESALKAYFKPNIYERIDSGEINDEFLLELFLYSDSFKRVIL